MYCPNCGEKLIALGQNFCQKCGFNTSVYTNVELSNYRLKPNRIIKKKKSMNPYSKKRLIFGIISLAALISALNYGASFLGNTFLSSSSYYSDINAISLRIYLIAIIVIHIIGLIFGILSIYYNISIRKLELELSDHVLARHLGTLEGIAHATCLLLAIFLGGLYLS